MAAHEGQAKEDAETGCIEEAEIGVIGIVVVQEPEEEADGEDGGPRADFAEECLEGEAVEEQFFGGRTGQDQDGEEEDGAPICAGAGTGFEVGPVERERHNYNQKGGASTACQAEQPVAGGGLIPGEARGGQGKIDEDAHGQRGGGGGGGQLPERKAGEVAEGPMEGGDGDEGQDDVEEKEDAGMDGGPTGVLHRAVGQPKHVRHLLA